ICVDELYESILSSRSLPQAADARVHQLEKAIRNVAAVCAPSWKERLQAGVSFDFSARKLMADFAFGTATAWAYSFLRHVAIPGAELAAGALYAGYGQLAINWKSLLKPKNLPDSLSPYVHLVHAEKKFPGTLPMPGA